MPQNNSLTVKELARLSVRTATPSALQIVLSPSPNTEMVMLLILLYMCWFQKRVPFIVYVFALLEGVFCGFHFWWFGCPYIWAFLWIIATLLDKRPRSVWTWAAFGGGSGLLSGLFSSLTHLLAGGIPTALVWWTADIPLDILHGISNFILVHILLQPLDRLYYSIAQQWTALRKIGQILPRALDVLK